MIRDDEEVLDFIGQKSARAHAEALEATRKADLRAYYLNEPVTRGEMLQILSELSLNDAHAVASAMWNGRSTRAPFRKGINPFIR
jgi:hypothetical protein